MSTIEMESSLDKDATKKLMDSIMHDPRRVKVLTGLMKSMSPGGLRRDGMENDVEQLKKVKDLPLKKIKAPTLIVHDTDDADVSVADAAHAANAIPGTILSRSWWVPCHGPNECDRQDYAGESYILKEVQPTIT